MQGENNDLLPWVSNWLPKLWETEGSTLIKVHYVEL